MEQRKSYTSKQKRSRLEKTEEQKMHKVITGQEEQRSTSKLVQKITVI